MFVFSFIDMHYTELFIMLNAVCQEQIDVTAYIFGEHVLHLGRVGCRVVELVVALNYMGIFPVCKFEGAVMPMEEQVAAFGPCSEAVVHVLPYSDHGFLALDA